MPRCANKGCQKEFDESNNKEGSCNYHPGGPPVLEFDQFMALPTCTKGKHSASPTPAPASKPTQPTTSSVEEPTMSSDGVETYGFSKLSTKSDTPAPAVSATSSVPAPAQKIVEEEEDDPSVQVTEGTQCKRLRCEYKYVNEDESRIEGGCRYHPQGAIFHEGSKGYLCCKRRVLEFSEFLKIEGCKTGKHLFVGSKKDETKEEKVDCRLDHYQTPLQVHVSAFAKGADKEKSIVRFESQSLHLDLYLPSNKRVKKVLQLYGPINPETSTFRILGTKVDIVLQKPSAISWPLLELPPPGTELPPGYALTFGVSGRTGTVGGKEIVLSPEELARRGA
nr:uncharacterized protein I203_02981 [Kwoniella mangroviensis CBS 8507]OCF68314.1 hypothetical protein I203_02981 [Kwoniella mangroviensis CBS 8507]